MEWGETFVPEREKAREQAKEVLNYNIKKLYRLSFKKYPYLYKALRGDVGQFLRDIINFWRSKDKAILCKLGKPAYFLGTQMGTRTVRKKTTSSVTNKWLNYLCAIGLLNKIEQPVIYEPYRRNLRQLTGVNRNMLSYNYNADIEPINTFRVEKYTEEFLCECNENAKKLHEHNITAGNIGYNQLALNGLKDMAVKVYKKERNLSESKKLRELSKVESCIDFLIELNGYTTKQEIYDNLDIDDNEIDKVFRIFKERLWENRTYKAPTKQDREEFGLESGCWIIKNK